MIFFNSIMIGLKEIWAHKFRSLLTMMGIILGVASLVGMAAIIKGMENGMKESMIAMGGADKVLLDDQDVPVYQEHLADQAPGRTIHDVYALRAGAPLLKLISPEMAFDEDDVTITRGERDTSPSEFVGVWPAVLDMNMHTVEHGRFFTDMDEETASSVCVIGTGIRDDLFGSPDEAGHTIVPIGQQILINSQPFTIVGMFQHYEGEQEKREREMAKKAAAQVRAQGGPTRQRGWGGGRWSPFYRKNMTIYVPMNTMWVKFRSSTGTNSVPDPRLTDIDIKVGDMSKLETALQQARNVLMVTHRGIEDFNFRTAENQIESINTQIRNARLSGGIIAGISLLVGGIGIMNIMLASINERIREIGTCKAIGASGPAIFIQILVEAVVVAIFGACLGVVASYGLVHLLGVLTPNQNTPVVTMDAMLLAVAFSGCVGIIAGIFPAMKAARLDPIQALRYE